MPLAQTQKHWVEAMLGEDPYAAVPYFYDVASWSNPLLMGLDGGCDRARGCRTGVARAGRAAPAGRAGPPFAGDSEGAAEAAMRLLAQRRRAAGARPAQRRRLTVAATPGRRAARSPRRRALRSPQCALAG